MHHIDILMTSTSDIQLKIIILMICRKHYEVTMNTKNE